MQAAQKVSYTPDNTPQVTPIVLGVTQLRVCERIQLVQSQPEGFEDESKTREWQDE